MILVRVLLVALATAASVAMLAWFDVQMPMPAARPRLELSVRIDYPRLFADLSPEGIGRTHRRLVESSSRLAGTAGDLAASRFIEAEFRNLGLEVVVQPFPVTVPVTRWSRLLDAEGNPIPGVCR